MTSRKRQDTRLTLLSLKAGKGDQTQENPNSTA